MADSKHVDFISVMMVFVSLILVVMGIGGFISTKGSDFTGPVFKAFGEDWIIYILSGVLTLAGIGLLDRMTIKKLPGFVGLISMLVALLFWVLMIMLKDFVPGFSGMDFGDILNWIQNFAIDFMILLVLVQNMARMGVKAK